MQQMEMETAVLGGGCFWCVQAILLNLKGVNKITPGYCGGHPPNPTYQQVKTGTTGHVEVVQILFNPNIISYQTLLTVFMHIHDPTQEDGQGDQDIGTQYLSAIFVGNQSQRQAAVRVIQKQQVQAMKEGKKIFTTIREGVFYQAEQYHHNYFNIRGSENPYCNIIPPKIQKLRKLFKDLVKE